MNEIKFECPKCGDKYLVQVTKNVTADLFVSCITEDGPIVSGFCDPDSDLNFEESTVDHYECAGCGFRLPFTEWADVLKWIRENTKHTGR